jgi:hypothetical protein
MNTKFMSLILTAACLFMAGPAHAYIGPGAAVAFAGYVFGPLIAIVVALGLVLIWPARILYKKFKSKKPTAEDAAE